MESTSILQSVVFDIRERVQVMRYVCKVCVKHRIGVHASMLPCHHASMLVYSYAMLQMVSAGVHTPYAKLALRFRLGCCVPYGMQVSPFQHPRVQ